MSQLETLIAQIVERKQRLDDLKAQSPEMAEALALSDEYHELMNQVREMCNPTPAIPQPMYLMRPFWEGPAVHDATCTVGMWPSGVGTIRIVK